MKNTTQATPEIRPESGEAKPAWQQAETQSTSLDKVRFDYADSGSIDLSSSSSIGALLGIGAIIKTSKITINGDAVSLEYATDEKGRELVGNYMHESIVHIFDGIQAVGKLLAISGEEASTKDLHSLGWLLCGLAELGRDLRHELANLEHSTQRGGGPT